MLFQKRVIRTKLDIYVLNSFQLMVLLMVFNATFNNISEVPEDNHRPVASH